MKYELIIFDWDGTLMDSIDKIVLCMKNAATQQKQLVPSDLDIKNIIGLSLAKAMQQLFPCLTEQQQQSLVTAYKQQYHLLNHIDTPLYDGIEALLINLKQAGYKLAVATGKGRNGLDSMMQKSATEDLFSATVCADEANSKPHPLMINYLLKKLNITADKALMIGDSSYDLEMAANAGVDSIGVSYGVHDRDKLMQLKPITIVDSLPSELIKYI